MTVDFAKLPELLRRLPPGRRLTREFLFMGTGK
jgi:hypothetical protein